MGDIRRLQGPEDNLPDNEHMPEVTMQQEPQDFVVVFVYTSTDGEVEEEFGKMVNDVKDLYTFSKNNVRVYAVVEESAKKILDLIEKPKEE